MSSRSNQKVQDAIDNGGTVSARAARKHAANAHANEALRRQAGKK